MDPHEGFNNVGKFGGEHGIIADPIPKAHEVAVCVTAMSLQTRFPQLPAGMFGVKPTRF